MRAFRDLAVGDVVDTEAGDELAGGGVVNDLAGAFADARAVVMQLVEEIPAELLLEQKMPRTVMTDAGIPIDASFFFILLL